MIFVDLGAWTGDSTRAMDRAYGVEHAYLFEPNPAITPAVNCPSTLVRAAAWDKNSRRPFLVDTLHGQGSTLIPEKTTGQLDRGHPIFVECIDFAQWLADAGSRHEHIVVKMNIEGAEYRVIRRLFALGSITVPDTYYISFHANKIAGRSEVHDEWSRARLRECRYEPATYENILPGTECWAKTLQI